MTYLSKLQYGWLNCTHLANCGTCNAFYSYYLLKSYLFVPFIIELSLNLKFSENVFHTCIYLQYSSHEFIHFLGLVFMGFTYLIVFIGYVAVLISSHQLLLSAKLKKKGTYQVLIITLYSNLWRCVRWSHHRDSLIFFRIAIFLGCCHDSTSDKTNSAKKKKSSHFSSPSISTVDFLRGSWHTS